MEKTDSYFANFESFYYVSEPIDEYKFPELMSALNEWLNEKQNKTVA